MDQTKCLIPRRSRSFQALSLLGLWLCGSAWGQDRDSKLASDVRELLDGTAKAYGELSAYADAGHLSTRVLVRGEAQPVESDVPIRFERPNRLALSVDGVTVVCDGKQLRTDRAALKKYRTEPAPAQLSLGLLGGGALGAVLTGGAAEHPAGLVLRFLLNEKAADRLLEGVTAGRVESEVRFEGVDQPLTALTLERGDRPGLKLGIDPASHLVRAVDLLVDSGRLGEKAPPGVPVAEWSMRWRSGPISTVAPEITVFSTAPPAGYTAVASAQAAAPLKNAEASPLVGKPAPDFRFDLLVGKATKPVARQDLVGKVIVLGFWATWCGPCKLELPEIQALTERLSKQHAGQVQVIAVSQDRAPDDGSPVRGLVESTLAELKVKLGEGPVGQVALDPDQVTGDAFAVTGLPTIVILDQKGVVQAVHVGYQEGVGETLFEQIETLLVGKSLVEPAPSKPGQGH